MKKEGDRDKCEAIQQAFAHLVFHEMSRTNRKWHFKVSRSTISMYGVDLSSDDDNYCVHIGRILFHIWAEDEPVWKIPYGEKIVCSGNPVWERSEFLKDNQDNQLVYMDELETRNIPMKEE